jgi:COMPASS component SWD3
MSLFIVLFVFVHLANIFLCSRVWDTATGQCLRTLVHEDNAPVTTVRFSPNGRYILAFTLDSCIRLWDYVSGTCKKTYQGHANKKYSLGGAFGVGGTEGFIVSGSEDGNLVFWDVRTKDMVQKVSGHEGVVLWADTCPGVSGKVVSGGVDGTVRIWVDINEDEDGSGVNGVKAEPTDADATEDEQMEEVKVEDDDEHDTLGESSIGREAARERELEASPEPMDED